MPVKGVFTQVALHPSRHLTTVFYRRLYNFLPLDDKVIEFLPFLVLAFDFSDDGAEILDILMVLTIGG